MRKLLSVGLGVVLGTVGYMFPDPGPVIALGGLLIAAGPLAYQQWVRKTSNPTPMDLGFSAQGAGDASWFQWVGPPLFRFSGTPPLPPAVGIQDDWDIMWPFIVKEIKVTQAK
jgi:hypothetical protein